MHVRIGLRARPEYGFAQNCAQLCAEQIAACTVLTKLLTIFARGVIFAGSIPGFNAHDADAYCMFCRRQSQKSAECRLRKTPFLQSTDRALAKINASGGNKHAKTNNEGASYANCKMYAKAILQVFKLRLQNAKPCAISTKTETRFCRKQLIFSAK